MTSRCIPGPDGGLYRTARWPDPFEFPPPPDPLPNSAEPVYGGFRWDDPEGKFTSLYCATTAEGAFGETIGRYREVPGLMERIDDYFDEEPDPEFDPDLKPGEVPEDYFEDRVLGRAPLDESARFVDTQAPETHEALNTGFSTHLNALGIPQFDRGVMMSQDRRVTRPIAGHYRKLSLTPDHDELEGLCYESRLTDRWQCWAVWGDPSPFRLSGADPLVPVTRENPDLCSAAERLGVRIPPT